MTPPSSRLVLTVLLVCSVILNALLEYRLSSLRGFVGSLTYTQHGLLRNPGDPAPPLRAKTLDGSAVTIDFSDSALPTVLYVFSPDCRWCTENAMNVRALIAKTAGRFSWVGVSLKSRNLVSRLEEMGLGIRVLMEPSWDTQVAYGLGATPMTFVVSGGRTVEKVWVGAYAQDIAIDVERFFGVRLPGLTGRMRGVAVSGSHQ